MLRGGLGIPRELSNDAPVDIVEGGLGLTNFKTTLTHEPISLRVVGKKFRIEVGTSPLKWAY